LLTLVFFLFSSLCYGGQSNYRIDTQVVRILATKKSGYYHKPWKSPNFETASASGFFFEDEKNFPGIQDIQWPGKTAL
jgi:hypothetical protein